MQQVLCLEKRLVKPNMPCTTHAHTAIFFFFFKEQSCPYLSCVLILVMGTAEFCARPTDSTSTAFVVPSLRILHGDSIFHQCLVKSDGPFNGTGRPFTGSGTGRPFNGTGRPFTGTGRPFNGTGRPFTGSGTGRPFSGTGRPFTGTGRPFTGGSGTGRPFTGTGRPFTGRSGTGRPFTGTGRSQAGLFTILSRQPNVSQLRASRSK